MPEISRLVDLLKNKCQIYDSRAMVRDVTDLNYIKMRSTDIAYRFLTYQIQ